MVELSTRLSAREQESIDALASAATNEIELKGSLQQSVCPCVCQTSELITCIRIASYEKEIQNQSSELQSLRILKTE